MMRETWKNRITALLGCEFPIVSGPMRLITLGRMAASVSNAGGFGVIAASGLTRAELEKELRTARTLTGKPVGVNIPVYRPNAAEALEVAIDMGVKTVYTSAGSPAKMMDRIKAAGLTVIHKVSGLDMARKAASTGVDAVVAMGFEAGGHVGRDAVTTFCLIPVLARALGIPVIASGGIGDARGMLAALVLGAEGVEIGTRLVATRECPVPQFFKDSLCSATGSSTVVLGSQAMPIRVLKNAVTARVAGMDGAEADRAMAAQGDAHYVGDHGNKDTAVMPCGQVAGLVDAIVPVEDLLAGMVDGVRSLVDTMAAMTSGVRP
ncbi:MAG: nitronate monooxygenase [Desulfobacterota bacterium]|nr:nitronate monooxygenase [Thermodesulfobacteriota bacterium]